jgi:hypothetical protein
MASDFEFTGIQHHRAGFREKATGLHYWLDMPLEDAFVELLDGDEVAVHIGAQQRAVYSIRENREV